MPTNRHLHWMELTDFSAGIHNRRSGYNALTKEAISGPSVAFAEMVDYVPQSDGGVRAFFKETAASVSGLTDHTHEAVTGVYERGGVPLRSGGTDAPDRLLATVNGADFKFRLYRMDGSNAETTWKQQNANWTTGASAAGGCQATQFAYFKDTLLNEYYLMVSRDTAGGHPGLYTLAYVGGAGPPAGDGVLTKIQAYTGPVIVNQARIIIAGGNDELLHYSNPGSLTFGASSFVGIEPNKQLPVIVMLVPFAPDDIIIAKEGAPWVQLSGDISSANTAVREMGDEYHARFMFQEPARVPGGVAFIEPGGKVYVTDGRNFQSISDAIPDFQTKVQAGAGTPDIVSPGNLAFLNGYLFAPDQWVYDFTVKAWFKRSGTRAAFYAADEYAGRLMIAGRGLNFGIADLYVFEGDAFGGAFAAKRMDTASFKTLPFADPNGRNVEIREVQVFAECFASSSIEVTLLDQAGNVVADQIVANLTNKGMTRFLFPNPRRPYMSVKVTAWDQAGTGEAPLIERVRLGFGATNAIT